VIETGGAWDDNRDISSYEGVAQFRDAADTGRRPVKRTVAE
jgi:hypothetical protein